jgi:opacity protein-like surface antigen
MSLPEKVEGVVVVLLSVIAATTVDGQGVRVEPGVGLSITVPTGEFHSTVYGDGYNVGWQGTALVDLQLPVRHLGLRLEGSYDENAANDKINADLSLQNPGTTEKIKVLGGSVDVTYTFRPSADSIAEYVLAGIGVYDVKVCSNAGCGSGETRVAWNAGAGISHRLSRRAVLFLEARYFKFASVNASGYTHGKVTFVPVTAGMRWGS